MYKNPRLKHVKKIKELALDIKADCKSRGFAWVLRGIEVTDFLIDQCNLLLETKKGKKLKKVSEDIVSICCKAPVYVKGNVTMNYVCYKCDKACDVTVLSTYSPLLTCKEASEKLLEATRGIPSQPETKKKKSIFYKETTGERSVSGKPLPQPEISNLHYENCPAGNGHPDNYCNCPKSFSQPEKCEHKPNSFIPVLDVKKPVCLNCGRKLGEFEYHECKPSSRSNKCDLHRTLNCPYCFAPQPEIDDVATFLYEHIHLNCKNLSKSLLDTYEIKRKEQ